jgi:hypothetical protein
MLSNDQLGVKLGHSAMSAQCPHCPKADVDPRIVDVAKVPKAGICWLRNRL